MTKKKLHPDESHRLLAVEGTQQSLLNGMLKIKPLLHYLLTCRSPCLIIETILEISEILEQQIYAPSTRNYIGVSTAGFSFLSISPELYHSIHTYRAIFKSGRTLNSGQWLHFIFTITSFISFAIACISRGIAASITHETSNEQDLNATLFSNSSNISASMTPVPPSNHSIRDLFEWFGLGSFAVGVLCDNIASTIGGVIPHPTSSNPSLQTHTTSYVQFQIILM